MNNDKIWSSIARKIAGEYTTEQDNREISDWLERKETNKKAFDILTEVWDYEGQSKNKHSSLFSSIKRRIAVFELTPSTSRVSYLWLKVAAVIFFLLASNSIVYYFTQNSEAKHNEVAWQEIVVPRGNRMKLVLPDSTTVWLNNETRLRYSSQFAAGDRQVELSGEGYFDVKHDGKHPFVVHVGNESIRVLGTRFSVNAYPEDQVIETSLISGAVRFESSNEINGTKEYLLKPGYSLLYNKQKNTISTEKIQQTYYSYWEKGIYSFKDESLESLAVKIKRIFNVEVVFVDDFLRSKTYTGTISINDNIYLFMEAVRRTSVEPIEYEFKKNIIYVKLKK